MTMVKVSKDGTIKRGDDVIGRVEKRELGSGLHETERGVSFGSDVVKWYAYDGAGTLLRELGYDKRKDAVRRVEEAAEPLTVTDMKVETVYGLLGGDPRECVTATVRWQGNYASVSRYATETVWIVDYFKVAGTFFPVFSHGTGARYSELRSLQGEQESATTAEAVRLGLLPAPVQA